jgi:lipopolysaccharide export system permease protein
VINKPDPRPDDSQSPAALGSLAIARQILREKGLVDELGAKLSASDASAGADTKQIQANLDHHKTRLFRLQAEVPRRFSNGLGCLCFAMIGMPVAMWRRSSDAMSVFFVCFMPILLVYYPLLVIGENMARDGVFPQLSVWLADSVLFAIGTVLLLRLMRH